MQASKLLSALIFIFFSIGSSAEVIFIDGMDFVARGCTPNGKAPFLNPTHDERCANKAYCMNSDINCYFIDKVELSKHKGNWQEIVGAGPSFYWIQSGTGIFCSQQSNSCEVNFDFDTCANEAPEKIQCSMQDLPGIPRLQTIPKKIRTSQ